MRKLYKLRVLALLAILMLSTMAAYAINAYQYSTTIKTDMTDDNITISGGGSITIAQGGSLTNNDYLSITGVTFTVRGKLVINSQRGSWSSSCNANVYLSDGGSFVWNGNEKFSTIPSHVRFYGFNAGTDGNGTVEATKDGVAVESNTQSGYYDELTFTATPSSGFRFMNWTKGADGEVLGTDPTISITCEENGKYQLYANFEREAYFSIEDYPSVTGQAVALKQSDFGRVVCSNGAISNNYSEAVNAGRTPEGMIAHIDWASGKALLVGLNYDGTNSLTAAEAKSQLANLPSAIGGLWRVPTVDEWKNLFIVAGSTDPISSSTFYYQDFRDMLYQASSGNVSTTDGPHWTIADDVDSEVSPTFSSPEEMVSVNGSTKLQTVYKATFSETNPSTPKYLLPLKEFNITLNLNGLDFEEKLESDSSTTLHMNIIAGTNEGQLMDMSEAFMVAKIRNENVVFSFSNGGESPIAKVTINRNDVSGINSNGLIRFGAKYLIYEDTPGNVNLVFDFRLEDKNGKPLNLGDGTMTLTMPYETLVPAGKTPTVWCYNRSTLMEQAVDAQFDTSTKVLTFSVPSF